MTGQLPKSYNIVWLITAGVGTLVAIVYYNMAIRQSAIQATLEFESYATPRYALFASNLEKADGNLRAIGGFLGMSDNISQDRFRTFISQLNTIDETTEYCWYDAAESVILTSMESGTSFCQDFSPVESSNVFVDQVPRLLISMPVVGRFQNTGFTISVFPVASLLPVENEFPRLKEYLLLMDTSRNIFRSYDIETSSLAINDEPYLNSAGSGISFPLQRIGGFDVVYLAQQVPEFRSVFARIEFLVSALIFLTSMSLSFYLRAILSRKNVVENLVELRTDELSQFAFRASHDLKSPLSTISALLKFTMVDLKDLENSEAKDNLTKIAEQIDRLQNLVTDILTLAVSDVESGEHKLVDINSMVRLTAENIALSAKENEVKIELDLGELGLIESNNIRILQILENLCTNSIKYAAIDGRDKWLKLTTRQLSGRVRVTVADNGVGIPEKYHQQLFTVFKRFHPSYGTGSGLGMTIVKRHVDALQSSIKFQSNENIGTTIELDFPKKIGNTK